MHTLICFYMWSLDRLQQKTWRHFLSSCSACGIYLHNAKGPYFIHKVDWVLKPDFDNLSKMDSGAFN